MGNLKVIHELFDFKHYVHLELLSYNYYAFPLPHYAAPSYE